MSWRDTIKPAEQDSGWRGTIAPIQPEPKPIDREKTYGPVVPIGETIFRSGGQAITLDMLDELMAGGKAFLSPGDWEILYQQFLEEEREKTRLAEEANPLTATVSRLGGYALPGLGVARALKGAGIAGRTAGEAGLGAIQGYGSAETQEEELPMMGVGAATGAGGSLGIEALGKAARTGLRKAGDIAGLTVFGTPTEVTQALRKDPRVLEGAKPTSEIAEELVKRLQSAKRGLGSQREQALATLGDMPLQNKPDVINQIEDLADQFGVTGAAESYPGSQAILNEIQLARDAITRSANESDVKNILARLDEKADFTTASGSQINAVRKQIITSFRQNRRSAYGFMKIKECSGRTGIVPGPRAGIQSASCVDIRVI